MTTPAPLLGEPLPVELMNTIWADRDGVHDALGSAEAVGSWLAAVADRLEVAPEPGVPAGFSGRIVDLRDALRRLAAAATGDDRAASVPVERAVAVVNAAAARTPRWSVLDASTSAASRHARRSAPEAALSQIADEAIALLAGPDRAELRACRGPGCVLYFVRQQPRRAWCSAACGNRARVARHYHRHAGAGR